MTKLSKPWILGSIVWGSPVLVLLFGQEIAAMMFFSDDGGSGGSPMGMAAGGLVGLMLIFALSIIASFFLSILGMITGCLAFRHHGKDHPYVVVTGIIFNALFAFFVLVFTFFIFWN